MVRIAVTGEPPCDLAPVRAAIHAALRPYGLPAGARIGLAFVDDFVMKELNARHRHKARTTDVLSFGQRLPLRAKGERAGRALQRDVDGELEVGDIVISGAQALRQAKRRRQPLVREVAFLAAHGALHLLGFEDETREGYREMVALGTRAVGTARARSWIRSSPSFIVLSALLTILPGNDTALVMRTTLVAGRRAAFATTCGISLGIPVHAAASALGLSAVLATSATAFEVVKWAGAAYLAFVGIQTIRRELRRRPRGPRHRTPVGRRARTLGGAFAQGFLTNVLNPKVALFYLTFLPQFMSPGDDVLRKSLGLGLIHVALGLPWLTAYALLVDRLARAVTRARPWLERASGALLIGLGVRLALKKR